MSQDNVYSADPQLPPPRNSTNSTVIVIAAIGLLGLLMTVFCCGGGLWLTKFGFDTISAELLVQLRDHPQVREHLGEITKLTVDFTKSSTIDDVDTFVYEVQGTRGRGEFTIRSETLDDGSELIRNVTLRMASGRVIEIDVGHVAAEHDPG